MTNPNIAVLITDGTNCDREMVYAFEHVGADAERIHITELRSGEKQLQDYGGLAIPGGFTYGDYIASGRVLASQLTTFLSDQIAQFRADEKPILGVCNGDQVLVKSGLLPFGTIGEQKATLIDNTVGRFECRWIDMKIGESACKFVQPQDFEEVLPNLVIPMQTAHGEGRFVAGDEVQKQLHDQGQIVFTYCDRDGNPSGAYPANPSGSLGNIAGITDESGLILGMMPHPERSISAFHPHRIRTEAAQRSAEIIFRNFVTFTKES